MQLIEKDDLNSPAIFKIGGRPRELMQRFLPIAVVGALASLLIANLAPYWAVHPQYSFGWFVPLLCAYLFLLRWRTRPPPEPAPRSGVARWFLWVAGFALLPSWLVEQSNPDWRSISWLLAFEIVVLTLCTIYFIGGRSWLRHFAFSIAFILIAVPWPQALEDFVVQELTRAATVATVASLNLSHIPAMQQGNLIQVQTGLVGVDEACSGIRSLQAALMVSVFLGELYRASKRRRVLLIFAAVLIAFLCNIGRTFFLAASAAKEGLEAISRYHDPLGFTVLAITLLLILGLAARLCGPLPKLPSSTAPSPNPLSWRFTCGLGLWVILTVIGVEAWYRVHETGAKLRWSFAWPVDKKDFFDVPFSNLEAEALICDEKRGAEWTNADGNRTMAFFFKWAEGPARSRILARIHRPENCLPAAGYTLRQDRGIIPIKVKGIEIPFRSLDFEDTGDPVYVFFCLWEDRLKQPDRPRIIDHVNEWTRFAKLESVFRGERNLGQQVLEIVMFGYNKPEEAEAAFRREVGTLIR